MIEEGSQKAASIEESDWNLLGHLAREAIAARLRNSAPPAVQDVSEALKHPAGVFVTLYCNGTLRGCVGTLGNSEALHHAVARLAVAAAFEDYRFPPVCEEELDELTIEISVLSPPREIATPDEIELGRHGLILTRDGNRAVFLPKVASEQGWDRMTLLEQLCRKAGLPTDAWRWEGTKLFVFTVTARTFFPGRQTRN